MKPYVSITQENITLIYPQVGETHTVERANARKAVPVLDFLKEKKYADLYQFLKNKDKFLAKDGFDMQGDEMTFNGKPVHEALKRRILEARELGLEISPFVKFMERLANNPSKNSVDNLFTFLEANDMPIDDEGYFLAYKAVRSDMKDKHSGTVVYGLNQEVRMPRNEVDDNPDKTCSHGLHVCSKDYGRFAERVFLCRVDPADVVCVPNEYNAAKMRVCALTLIAEIEDFKRFECPIYGADYEGFNDYDDEAWDYEI